MAATAASTMASSISLSGLSASRSSINGVSVQTPKQVSAVKSVNLVCRAQQSEDNSALTRRSALTLLAGAAALTLKASPAEAAYGESANVFGKVKTNTDYRPYTGDGFSVDIPSKWNPSKEPGEFANVVLRYEDNFDALINLVVIAEPTTKGDITEFGSPEEFLEKYKYLLGKQSFEGATASEGGFAKNATATAAILESGSSVKNGKTYYNVSVLTRTADGNEGGRHHVITATVSGDKLYIFKSQSGDKRWFKGAKKFVEGAAESFTVA